MSLKKLILNSKLLKFFSIKETGIVIGYLTLLLGVLFFEWRPFPVFLSFLIEFIVILLIYVFLSLHRGVSKRRDEPPLFTVLIAGLAIGAVNMAFGNTLVFNIIKGADERYEMENIVWTVAAILISLLVLHIVSVKSRWNSPELMDKQRSMIFTGVIAISAMNVAGLFVWSSNENGNPNVVIFVMVTIRILAEVWMNHFQKVK